MGIMATGSSLGGVLFPIMISRMIQTTGYPWAMRTGAFVILGLQVIAILTVRPRTVPTPKKMPADRFAAPFKEFPFVMLLLGIFVLTYVPHIHPHRLSGLAGFSGDAHVRGDGSILRIHFQRCKVSRHPTTSPPSKAVKR